MAILTLRQSSIAGSLPNNVYLKGAKISISEMDNNLILLANSLLGPTNQITGSLTISGSLVDFTNVTSVIGLNITGAIGTFTGSFIGNANLTGSLSGSFNGIATGSFTGSFNGTATGSLQGTASWAATSTNTNNIQVTNITASGGGPFYPVFTAMNNGYGGALVDSNVFYKY